MSHSLPAKPVGAIPTSAQTVPSQPNLAVSQLPSRPRTVDSPSSARFPVSSAVTHSSLPAKTINVTNSGDIATSADRKPTSDDLGASNNLTKKEETKSEDRKPSLPPPSPYSASAAPVSLIDSRRESFRIPSGSNSPRSRSRSKTPPLEQTVRPKREDSTSEEDVKPPTEKSAEKAANGTPAKGRGRGRRKTAQVEIEPQLIGDLPRAEEEAGRTFTEILESSYYSRQLGNTPYYDPDAARCDCVYRAGEPLDHQACGEYSGCMNRMLQIECEAGDCRCGGRCQNQRFQNREYAPIEIVKTEKKGFGVRAMTDMTADTFVYEYVGEVIGPAPFARKMKDYAQEGIKHFYFMALDKEVFIDATKKGGKGRFLNHSCNPNCQVAKWTVGKKMRMGIFTKRDIKKNEELTFNYNVDRYGHLAQECFCGEPNCVGFIGGKTQTDIGGMDDLYIDALGIADEVEALGLKGNKKRKGKKLDEDYIPTLTPIISEDVPKVASAIRQALQTRRILGKLLERVQMTHDEEVQRQLLRLHGLSLMNNILKEYPKDNEILTLDLTVLTKWKFQTRNKIETSKIEDEVNKYTTHDDETIAKMAQALLAAWSELSLGFRIPKAQRDASDDSDLKRPSHFDIDQLAKRSRLEEEAQYSSEMFDRSDFVRPTANVVATASLARPRKLPYGWTLLRDDEGRDYYVNDLTRATQREVPLKPAEGLAPKPVVPQTFDANALLAEAERAAREAKELEDKRREEEELEKKREREERHRRKKEEKEAREKAQKDKKVMGLFSAVVVSTMSKYRSQFDPDAFKKRAKEVTELLLDKEKKRPTYDTDVYETLSSEKESKVKSFVKDWVKKLLERKKNGRSSSSGSTPRPAPATTASSRTSTSSRPSLSTRPDSSSSNSTPRPAGVDFDSPATPQTVQAMEVDTPMSILERDKDKPAANGAGTPPGTPPSRRDA
ncbi:uncharacterized protein JCM15063_002482 [Sporobolomyces koalae]|uniref:uncharacterized protein n=1 Tax=Sporobolomyces koalae TaxID=500713 RepID=UPI0031759E08